MQCVSVGTASSIEHARFDSVAVSDVNECSEKLECSCPHCSCKNIWGGFDCKCSGGLMYLKSEDTSIGELFSSLSSHLAPAFAPSFP
jgi:hypothetical protein